VITLYKKGSNDKMKASVYLRIAYLMENGRYEEAKNAIEQFLSIIDNECRRW